jgi:superfamily II DNA or RNA helicase
MSKTQAVKNVATKKVPKKVTNPKKAQFEYKSGYVIPKDQLTKLETHNLITSLTLTPEGNDDFHQKNADPTYTVFREDEKNFYVPKFWGKDNFPRFIQPCEEKNSTIDFNFNGKLRGSQPEVSAFILDKLEKHHGGLLQLHTGYGKTTLAIYIASILKLKTLVIVHKSFLQDQWYERIQQFTDANIGMIRQKKVDVEGKDIVIAMLQSVSMIDYDPVIFKDFDLLIVDECFPHYTQIMTNNGLYSIRELYNLWKNDLTLPLIQSFNEKYNVFEYKKMTYAWKKHTRLLVRVNFENGFIECTPNHKFLTLAGYKEAKTLTATDKLIGCYSGKSYYIHIFKVLYVCEIIVDDINKDVFDIEVEDNHNFVVIDTNTSCGSVVHNCHHIASKVFSQALFKMLPKYTIALSATPNRNDGMTKAIHWFLGDTIIKVERKCDNIVYVKSFDYTTINPLFTEKTKNVKGKTKPDVIKMTTNICKIDERNNFITNIIDALKFIPNRKILVLSKRIEHLKTLKTMSDKIIQEQILSGKACEDEYTTAFYVGGMKEWQLKESSEADIIFGTYDIASEGLDIDGLNTLVLANSIKDPVQAIGRILRKPLEEGDTNPLIIDICDNLSCYKKWSKDRVTYYKQNKYKVDYIRVNKDRCIPMYEYMVTNKMIEEGEYDIENLRKLYITHMMGIETYEFEKKLKFKNYPDSMFSDVSDYNKMFEINHDFSNINNDQGSIINYDPITIK